MRKRRVSLIFVPLWGAAVGVAEEPKATFKRTPKVEVVTVQDPSRSLETILIPGEVVARSRVNVESQAEGQVAEVPVELGREIKRGQPFLTLQNPDPQYTGRKFTVMAPITGMVADILPQIGQKVRKDEVVGAIVDVASLQVVAHVPGHYLERVRKGGTALLTIGKDSHPLTIDQVSPSPDAVTGTLKTYLHFDHAVNVKLGALGQIKIASPASSVLFLPRTAVDRHGEVQLVIDGKIHPRKVELGKVSEGRQEILGGVKAGDVVLREAATWLHKGDAVETSAGPVP